MGGGELVGKGGREAEEKLWVGHTVNEKYKISWFGLEGYKLGWEWEFQLN